MIVTSPRCSCEPSLLKAREENQTQCPNFQLFKRQVVPVSKKTWSGLNPCVSKHGPSESESTLDESEGKKGSEMIHIIRQVTLGTTVASLHMVYVRAARGFELRSSWVITQSHPHLWPLPTLSESSNRWRNLSFPHAFLTYPSNERLKNWEILV